MGKEDGRTDYFLILRPPLWVVFSPLHFHKSHPSSLNELKSSGYTLPIIHVSCATPAAHSQMFVLMLRTVWVDCKELKLQQVKCDIITHMYKWCHSTHCFRDWKAVHAGLAEAGVANNTTTLHTPWRFHTDDRHAQLVKAYLNSGIFSHSSTGWPRSDVPIVRS